MADQGVVETPAQEELDVDKLLADLKEPAPERPMEGGAEALAETPEAPKAPDPWWSSVEFEWNGKKIKPDSEDKARTWMSQGYNYAQRAGELNKQQAQWQKERDELLGYKKKLDGYSQVDEYAAKNPEWWNHVQESWKTREVPQGVDPSIAKVLTPIQEKMSKFEDFLGQIEAQKREAEATKENEALDQEIGSIRKQYPNIDLTAKDESGETLERRVLKHALEIQTTSFRAAFRDYLHDQLVTQAQANGKEAIVKDQQLKAKKGLLGTTPAPVKELKPVNTKLPWNHESMKGSEILKEMGI
jgi:hypothetical protein